MSINLGNEGIAAARELRTSTPWAAIRDALHKQVVGKMNAAIECDPALRGDAGGYARALRDLWVAFESATTGENINRVAKPGPEKNSAAR